MASAPPFIPAISGEPPFPVSKPVMNGRRHQIEIWEEEIQFYTRLLSWLLYSCKEENRREIEGLSLQFSALQTDGLSQLSATSTDDAYGFYFFEENLRRMRRKLFQAFPRLAHLEIW